MKKLRILGLLFALSLLTLTVNALEVPPPTVPTYIQTNGPSNPLNFGDWYTSSTPGAGNDDHIFEIFVPCGWPASTPLHLDLFSPEMNTSSTTSDEVYPLGGTFADMNDTRFVLIAPNLSVLTDITYIPVDGSPEIWERFYTIPDVNAATCGTYTLRVSTEVDDQNGWRMRLGLDNDVNPNNAPPANTDNPDGVAGTYDEIAIGQQQTSYQHDEVGPYVDPATPCLTLYQYVDPGQPSVTFNNFDLDNNQRVRYYAPSDVYDSSAQVGGTVGTVSGLTAWNNGDLANRGGDTILNPESGWWRIVSCVNNDNQYIQEGARGLPTFYRQPPTPRMTVTKDNGVTEVLPGQPLTYTINFENVSDIDPVPGAATNVVITDTIPVNTTYVSCAITAPYTGTCSQAGGVVTFNLDGGPLGDGVVPAGGTGSVTVTVNVSPSATGTVLNSTTLNYRDTLDNPFPPVNDTDEDPIPSNPQADLLITKTDGSATYTPGGTTTYTITVGNNGPNDAFGATVSDTKPASITSWTWTCVPAGGATCTAGPQVLTGDFTDAVNVPVGGTLTYTVVATIDAAATGNLVNTAIIIPPPSIPDPTPGNNTSTDTDTPTPSADLSITKTDGVTEYIAGGTTTYTIVVNNVGPSNVTGATVGDVKPASITSWTWTCAPTGGATCTAGPQVLTGNFSDTVNIPVGGTLTYTVVATIDAAATGNLVNTATVTTPPGTTDPTPGNNTSTDTDTPTSTPSADLSITKDDGVTEYTAGGTVVYTIVVNNAGPNNVTGATVSDPKPAQIASWTWTCIPTGTATCTAGPQALTGDFTDTVSIAAGAGNFLTYTVSALINAGATGDMVNTVTVTTPPGTTDPTPGNNTSTDTDTRRTPSADLSITKDDGVTEYIAGGTLTYTIVVNNAGPDNVINATVNDVIPAQFTQWVWSCVPTGNATCAAGPATLFGNFSDIVSIEAGAGNFLTYTVVATIDAAATGNIVNTVTVSTPPGTTDPTPGNNTDTDTDVPQGTPNTDLAVTKDDGVTEYVAGGTLTYTIVVSNNGPADVVGATVTDAIPGQVAEWTWTCVPTGAATCTAGPVTSSTDFSDTVNIAVGETLTYTVNVLINNPTGDSLTNTVYVNTPPGIIDTDPNNNNDTDIDDPVDSLIADLSIVKTDVVDVYAPGGTLTYTIVVSNNGPDDAFGATITDNIPAQITSWTWTCTPTGAATCTAGPVTSSANFTDTVDVPLGETLTYTVVATVASDAVGDIANTATVTTPPGTDDPTPNNTTSTDINRDPSGGSPTPTQPPSLVISDPFVTKSVNPPFTQPGEVVIWTINVTNPGVVGINDVTVQDNLPSEIIIQSANSATGIASFSGQTVTLSVGTLNPGQTVSMTVTTRVRDDIAVPFVIRNIACARSSNAAERCGEATVTSVSSLPATGETPIYRDWVLVGAVAVLAFVVMTVTRRVFRRQTR